MVGIRRENTRVGELDSLNQSFYETIVHMSVHMRMSGDNLYQERDFSTILPRNGRVGMSPKESNSKN